MLNIDLTGRRALVAGVADDGGFGFAIAKALAEAGASVVRRHVAAGAQHLPQPARARKDGRVAQALVGREAAQFEKIYPLDAAYTTLASAPESIRTNKRYAEVGDFSIDGLAARLVADHGEKPLDIVVHSLANGPEVKKPLLETSREGYLTALSVSAYSLIAMVSRLGPLMRAGGSVLSLTYMASERVIPGYGGGMSSAKAALESDTRVLAYEAGRRFGVRVNTISAGRSHRAPRARSASSRRWSATSPPTRRSPSRSPRRRSAPPPRSSPARSRAASRAPSSTWIKAITPWGWPFPSSSPVSVR